MVDELVYPKARKKKNTFLELMLVMIRFSFRSTDLLLVTQGRALVGEEVLTRDKAPSSFPKSNRNFNRRNSHSHN